MSRFHPLEVCDVRRETPESVSLAFRVPKDLEREFAFQHGQYLTLRQTIGGNDLRRSYSICSGQDDGELRIAVKEVEGGAFSTFVNRRVAVGDILEVMPPEGRFTAPLDHSSAKTYVGIAAGSGITPIMSIIRTVLAREPESRFLLLYGNRTSGTVIFKNEIEDIKDRFLGRLTVYHVLSREAQDIDLLHGRLDESRIATLTRLALGDSPVDHAFLCGPQEMISSAREALHGLGVAESAIHFELFTTDGTVSRERKAAAQASGGADVPLSVQLDGSTHSLVIKPGETILEAAARDGVDLPHSCTGGMCCTCRARVTSGEVSMDQNFSLEPWELAAGYVLTCQSRPVKGPIAVDFDAA